METGGRGAAVSGGRAAAGGRRRKARAAAGTLAADMDLHCDRAAEPPAAEPPSGKINRAAFKLFKKRKPGGAMPSIFGVKNKGDGKGAGPAGLVRSRTHDGLAEALALEGGRREEPRAGGGDGGAAGPGRAERPRAPPEPEPEPRAGEGRPAEDAAGPGAAPAETAPRPDSEGGRAPAAPDPSSADPPSDPSADRICLMFSDVTSLKSFDSLTGCGDIIADPEDEAGPSCARHAPAPGQPGPAQKPPGVVAYQGGGEEMASPAEADDSYLQEFWDMLSQTEDQGPGPQQGAAPAAAAAPEAQVAPETPKDARRAEGAKDASSVKRRRLHRLPTELQPKEEPKHPDEEPQEGVPNSDEGYWDSPTPGPREDGSGGGVRKAGLPRDSDSGDALYDLYAEPDGSPAALPAAAEDTSSCSSRLKPVSPVTVTCALRTPGSLLKDSKIPISIKHLANLPPSHAVVHQQPTRSELPRTKIPVSKVLVRRVSSRGLAGTTLRAAACHDSAKKL
ncbi:APC membrane recruitment protein 2 [Sagmatias obliquidens]|uniref:APC membrane recruitment protein 2 n=1 Tax=Sagmatias obliquidens TaxID=3371155 RepID=UPI000F44196E|nr:APC membrane recruitment protein 2 [Lagenorhynchus obliquidens]